MSFKRVIIYGHKLLSINSHTQSFEHQLYYKTFKQMGFDVLWIDDADNIDDFAFSNSLVITEGCVDSKVPVRPDTKYIVHNPKLEKYESVLQNVLFDQMYSTYVVGRKTELIYEPFYFENGGPGSFKTLYHPWCTDVNPDEAEFRTSHETLASRERFVNFVGTVYPPGEWSNISVLQDLHNHSQQKYLSPLRVLKAVGNDHISLMRNSWVAPAVQGTKSVNLSLGVSRPYKIASYGRVPCTNSKHVYEVLGGFAGFSENVAEAVDKTVELEETMSTEKYHEMVKMVTEKFSYKRQVEIMLDLL